MRRLSSSTPKLLPFFNISTLSQFKFQTSLSSTSSNNINDNKSIKRIQKALEKRRKLCGLPNAYTSVFRAVNGVHDGLFANCIVDVAVCKNIVGKQGGGEERSFYLLPRKYSNDQEKIRMNEQEEEIIRRAFEKEGYEEFAETRNSSSKNNYVVRELGVYYPLSTFLTSSSSSSSLLLCGRAVRQAFYFDVLEGLYHHHHQQNSNNNNKKINVVSFNCCRHNKDHRNSSSMLCHLAAMNDEVVDKCFVFEEFNNNNNSNNTSSSSDESMTMINSNYSTKEIVKLQSRMTHQHQEDGGEGEEESATNSNINSSSSIFVSNKTITQIANEELKVNEEMKILPKYFDEKDDLGDENNQVQLATIEVPIVDTNDPGNKNSYSLQKFAIKKAIEMTYRGCFNQNDNDHDQQKQPARLYLVVYRDNNKQRSSAESYALQLLRDAALTYSHLNVRFDTTSSSNITNESSSSSSSSLSISSLESELNLMKKATDIMMMKSNNNNENKIGPYYPSIRIVKKVGAGAEFSKRASFVGKEEEDEEDFVGHPYHDVCGLLIEIW